MSSTQTLTNSFLGPSYTLQPDPEPSHNGALRLAPAGEKGGEGLNWTITSAPGPPGKYHISTATADGQPKRLDLYNDNSGNKTRIRLADPGFYAGQLWTFTPCDGDGKDRKVDDESSGKWFKLSNHWTGPGWYLDTYSGTHVAFMSQGEHSGQSWLITVPLPEQVTSEDESLCRGFGVANGTDVEALKKDQDGRWGRTYAVAGWISAMAVGFILGSLWERWIMQGKT